MTKGTKTNPVELPERMMIKEDVFISVIRTSNPRTVICANGAVHNIKTKAVASTTNDIFFISHDNIAIPLKDVKKGIITVSSYPEEEDVYEYESVTGGWSYTNYSYLYKGVWFYKD